ncbi:hypothetical protein [Kineococcus terrestris]|uniref:hypothetical protein n=1 Tax=Kineococcus terrestris TaxID=2044856 RepID=UPI0034DB6A89
MSGTGFSVGASARVRGTGPDLPAARVGLVAAPKHLLPHDQDELGDVAEWPVPVSLDFVGSSGQGRAAVASTVSQRVLSRGAALLLDSASGGPPWTPRPEALRRGPDDWGLRWPFDGWWVWPDLTGDFPDEATFTVPAPLEWTTGGRVHRGEVVLTLVVRRC